MSAKSPCTSAIPSSVCNVWEIHAPCENTYRVRVGSGTERPIVQCLNAATSHLFLGFRTIFKFATAELGPRTIVFRIPLRKLLDGNALPISEATFAHAGVRMHLQARADRQMHAPWQRHALDQSRRPAGSEYRDDGQHTVHAMRPLFDEPATGRLRRGECRSGLADDVAHYRRCARDAPV